MKEISNKIKELRKNKGFSHDYMADQLNMSQPAYSKIENDETKLSVDRLFEIAKILETPVIDILDISPDTVYNQTNTDNAVGYQQKIENFYQDNKEKSQKIEELYEERLKDKDETITMLKDLIGKITK